MSPEALLLCVLVVPGLDGPADDLTVEAACEEVGAEAGVGGGGPGRGRHHPRVALVRGPSQPGQPRPRQVEYPHLTSYITSLPSLQSSLLMS